MHLTMFETPVISAVFRFLAMLYLKLGRWKIVGEKPDHCRYVLIGAPHTSNWDVPLGLAICFVLGIKPYWMGKKSLFRWPIGTFMRWTGGLPIDRSKANNVVAVSIQAFEQHESLTMLIPPEGTRKQVDCWKTGFYHIAHGAGVPIVMGFLDFKNKTGGIGPTIWTTGDIDVDMRALFNFYAPISGKFPEQFTISQPLSAKKPRPRA